ncbi:MAG: hypothetical protein ACE5IY_11220 [bacterium]
MAPAKGTCERGYILFEALLSVTILSVGIVALLSASQNSLRSVQVREHDYGPARHVAEEILTRFELDALSGVYSANLPRAGESGGFPYEVLVSDWGDVPGLQHLSVTVRWENRGRPGEITLTTLLPKPQPVHVQEEE